MSNGSSKYVLNKLIFYQEYDENAWIYEFFRQLEHFHFLFHGSGNENNVFKFIRNFVNWFFVLFFFFSKTFKTL